MLAPDRSARHGIVAARPERALRAYGDECSPNPEPVADHPTRAEAAEKLADLIEGIRMAMLTTLDPSVGALRARPMAVQNERFDGKLFFFTDKTSAKVCEAEGSPGVCVAFADPGSNTYVSASGPAHVSTDRALMERFYSPFVKAWFPEGLEDPDISLLVVDVQHAEYWDSPSSTLVQLYGFVKAKLTGTPAEGGENEKVEV